MKIETRFNIGDEVFFMQRNKVRSATVKKIKIFIAPPKNETSDEDIEIFLEFKNLEEWVKDSFTSEPLPAVLSEDDCYSSKEELLKSL